MYMDMHIDGKTYAELGVGQNIKSSFGRPIPVAKKMVCWLWSDNFWKLLYNVSVLYYCKYLIPGGFHYSRGARGQMLKMLRQYKKTPAETVLTIVQISEQVDAMSHLLELVALTARMGTFAIESRVGRSGSLAGAVHSGYAAKSLSSLAC